jgi:hypothetical protein
MKDSPGDPSLSLRVTDEKVTLRLKSKGSL